MRVDHASLPLDLRDGAAGWSADAVGDEWRPIERISRRVLQDLDALADSVVDQIWNEIEMYRESGVPRADVRTSVYRNIEMMLGGLAENRSPNDAELAIRRELGRRRALQGLPVDALLGAYHVGYRELWLALVRAAAAEPPRTSELLLGAATTVWRWIHEITNAVGAAYHESLRDEEAQSARLRQHLLEQILSAEPGSETLAGLVQGQGFDSDGAFRAIAVRGAGAPADMVGRLQRALDAHPGTFVCGVGGPSIVALAQTEAEGEIEPAIRAAVGDTAIGIGLRRGGIGGARASIGDAVRALALARDDMATVRFEEHWLFATLHQARERLDPMLAAGVGVAAHQPHLAEAVEAFAAGGFSIAAAARSLHLHNNTVSYRLDRWRRLTGWDPHTLDGLVRSVAAIRHPPDGSARLE